jgi:hypothetical protein
MRMEKKTEKTKKTLIGWKERVDLPDWGVRNLKAKVDTGARTSALHVEDLVRLTGGRVRFYVVLDKREPRRRKKVVTKIRRKGRVMSSSGHYSTRIFVVTTLRIGEVEREIELNLVDREQLSFRLLLGRTALGKDFLIDAHRGYLLGKRKKRERKHRS